MRQGFPAQGVDAEELFETEVEAGVLLMEEGRVGEEGFGGCGVEGGDVAVGVVGVEVIAADLEAEGVVEIAAEDAAPSGEAEVWSGGGDGRVSAEAIEDGEDEVGGSVVGVETGAEGLVPEEGGVARGGGFEGFFRRGVCEEVDAEDVAVAACGVAVHEREAGVGGDDDALFVGDFVEGASGAEVFAVDEGEHFILEFGAQFPWEAVVERDGVVEVFEPRAGEGVVAQAPDPEGLAESHESPPTEEEGGGGDQADLEGIHELTGMARAC
jgi:hypothetical protein